MASSQWQEWKVDEPYLNLHCSLGEGPYYEKATNTLRETLRGIWKMVVRYPIWDVSYDVATIFTLGMASSH